MMDRTLLTLGAFRLDAVILAAGETTVEVLGRKAIAVILVSGQARCNGIELVPWRSMNVSDTYRLEAIEPCIVARFAVDGPQALHLGARP